MPIQLKTPQTCYKLSILPLVATRQQVATSLSISSSCNKSAKIGLVATCYLHIFWNKSVDNLQHIAERFNMNCSFCVVCVACEDGCPVIIVYYVLTHALFLQWACFLQLQLPVLMTCGRLFLLCACCGSWLCVCSCWKLYVACMSRRLWKFRAIFVLMF